MSRYLLAALLGLFAIFTLYGTGTVLRIGRGDTVTREEDIPPPPTAVPNVAVGEPSDLTELERGGRLVLRQTSAEALAQLETTPPPEPEPEPEPAPQPEQQPQTVEPAPAPEPQPPQEPIPALW